MLPSSKCFFLVYHPVTIMHQLIVALVFSSITGRFCKILNIALGPVIATMIYGAFFDVVVVAVATLMSPSSTALTWEIISKLSVVHTLARMKSSNRRFFAFALQATSLSASRRH
jgi:hypothetical protein